MARNFGSAHPEGYRKALRLMEQAQKFGRPVVCLVDTSGAYCGIEAEERGQGQAIAQNLVAMAGLRVPVVSVVIGEGGSGGAIGLAMADRVWMLENAVYSVISPEGCASILYKDAARADEAAAALGLTARTCCASASSTVSWTRKTAAPMPWPQSCAAGFWRRSASSRASPPTNWWRPAMPSTVQWGWGRYARTRS